MTNRIYANDFDEPYIGDAVAKRVYPTIKIVTDNPDQFQKSHAYDGGYDLISNEDITVSFRGRALVGTGLKVAIPKGYVGIICSRSGLASRKGLEKGAGIIDYGYTGEIKVLLHNLSYEDFSISKGDRIAQMLIVPICTLDVELVDDLQESTRGNGGFGSTGK